MKKFQTLAKTASIALLSVLTATQALAVDCDVFVSEREENYVHFISESDVTINNRPCKMDWGANTYWADCEGLPKGMIYIDTQGHIGPEGAMWLTMGNQQKDRLHTTCEHACEDSPEGCN